MLWHSWGPPRSYSALHGGRTYLMSGRWRCFRHANVHRPTSDSDLGLLFVVLVSIFSCGVMSHVKKLAARNFTKFLCSKFQVVIDEDRPLSQKWTIWYNLDIADWFHIAPLCRCRCDVVVYWEFSKIYITFEFEFVFVTWIVKKYLTN